MIVSGIYKITCTKTKKFYIGSSTNIKKRLKWHFYALKGGYHENPILQAVFNKYGIENLKTETLELCNSKIILSREQFYIDTLTPYFNINKYATKPPGKKNVCVCLKNVNSGQIVTRASIKEFAEEFSVDGAAVCLILQGKRKSTKGWCLPSTKKIYNSPVRLKHINTGEIIVGPVKDLITKYKLTQGGISAVLTGRQNNTSGWCYP